MQTNIKDLQNFMKENQYSWDSISNFLKNKKKDKVSEISFLDISNELGLEETFFLAKVFDKDLFYNRSLRKLSVSYALGKDNYFLNLSKEKQLNEFPKILNLTMKYINENNFSYDEYKKLKLDIAKSAINRIESKNVSEAEKDRLKGIMEIVISATCYSSAGSCMSTTRSILSYLKSNDKKLMKSEEERFIKLFHFIINQSLAENT